jgi:hypothetical protein
MAKSKRKGDWSPRRKRPLGGDRLAARSKKTAGVSPTEIAKRLSVDRRTVTDWIKTKGCPTTSLDAVIQWRASNLRPKRHSIRQRPHSGGDGSDGVSLQDLRLMADTAKIEVEVQLKNLRLQERMQNLVSKTAVLREVAELVVRVKERILAAPDEFETRFPAEVRSQCKSDFDEFVRQLMRELSQWEILSTTTDDIVVTAAADIVARRRADAAALTTIA